LWLALHRFRDFAGAFDEATNWISAPATAGEAKVIPRVAQPVCTENVIRLDLALESLTVARQ
jgi:hypothetical protein